ncbi:MAG: chorismate synthase [Halobacteriovoraceae bacterium]|nr:chorismate synthase [Halobacteriovoraceae bacterium]
MRGNSFGDIFTMTTFGESHGEAMGVVIDGMPAGLVVSGDDLQAQLDRRRPGRLKVSTSRNEADQAQILSGIFEGRTLGTPIAVMIKNTNQRSEDYSQLKNEYRPGHADKTTMAKFGYRDHRGGGRASGRETAARVIAGYFASLIIPEISFKAIITELGPYSVERPLNYLKSESQLGFADQARDQEIEKYLLELKQKGESAGGKVLLAIQNCPAGLGEPVFDKLKAVLGHAFLSIGSCMSVEFGLGHQFSQKLGSEISSDPQNFGGIEGGISNGEIIWCTLTFKAPSTVGEKAKAGRHDPCILPRVLPVVESMACVVMADQFLKQNAYQINAK